MMPTLWSKHRHIYIFVTYFTCGIHSYKMIKNIKQLKYLMRIINKIKIYFKYMNKIIDYGKKMIKKLERPIHFRNNMPNSYKNKINTQLLQKPIHFRNEIVAVSNQPKSLDRPIHFRNAK